jgi:hypothetical protein
MVDIEYIQQRYEHYSATAKLDKNTAVYHVRILLEEIEKLKKELDSEKQIC